MTAEKQPRWGRSAGGCNHCIVGFWLGGSHRARRDQWRGGWLRSGPDDNAAVAAGHALPVYPGDTYFKPNSLTTDSGAEVSLRLHNVSPLDHHFTLAAVGGSRGVPPGETVLTSFRVPAALVWRHSRPPPMGWWTAWSSGTPHVPSSRPA